MIRRFVYLVTENYKSGMYSLHRLDIYKHLFHQSRADARVVMPSLLAGSEDNSCAAGGDGQPTMLDRLKELPTAVTTWSSSNVDHFSLLGPRCGREEGRILCLSKVGTAVVYDPHSSSNFIMPGLKEFKGGPVSVSVSAAPAAVDDGEEEQLFIMNGGGGPDGLELNFNVLRYGPFPLCRTISGCLEIPKGWYWQSLPVPPPFVLDDRDPPYDNKLPAVISSYTVVDGGNGSTVICLSSVAADGDVGTYYLDTASCHDCEWKRADRDWVLPFTGKAEYISSLDLCLGFSRCRPGHLCAASDLSDTMLIMDHKPMPPLIFWPDHIHTPKEWMAVDAKLLSLGAGRFAVAKVFKVVSSTEEDTIEADEVLVLSGVELDFRGKDKNNLQGLKLLQHKSICYTCANGTAISRVL